MTREEALNEAARAAQKVLDSVRGTRASIDAVIVSHDAVVELMGALARLDQVPPESEGGWRPISTYPRDNEGWGPNVLLFVPIGVIAPASDYRLVAGRLEGEMWLSWDTDGAMFDIGQPTHWMPLPSPPPSPSDGTRET